MIHAVAEMITPLFRLRQKHRCTVGNRIFYHYKCMHAMKLSVFCHIWMTTGKSHTAKTHRHRYILDVNGNRILQLKFEYQHHVAHILFVYHSIFFSMIT